MKKTLLAGLKVVAWRYPTASGSAVNVMLLQKQIDDGVDGIIIDRPDVLRGILASQGIKVAPSF